MGLRRRSCEKPVDFNHYYSENNQKACQKLLQIMNQDLINIAREAALKAGAEIMSVYKSSDFKVEVKADQSPLTKADKAAHHVIYALLKKTGLPILSEEGKHIEYTKRKEWDTFWLVDPLDGTKEFIKRNGEFTVNIALIRKSTPVLGVVYVPMLEEIYYASEDGAFKATVNNGMINQETQKKLPGKRELDHFVVVGSRSHMSKKTEDYIETLNRKGKPLKIISKGSSLKICLVAEGAADCYPRLGPTMEWDTAAGHAIAKYSGKKVNIYPDNVPLIYNKENLLNPYFVVS